MTDILKTSETFVFQLFEKKLSASYFYHNLAHTQRVVAQVKQLVAWEGCSETVTQHLLVAAWLHDTGYTETDVGHEAASMQIAENFLTAQGISQETIHTIKRLIAVTKQGEVPQTIEEKIIKDADCAHLADPDYLDIADNLKQEIMLKTDTDISNNDWLKQNIGFFETHRFYTTSACLKWEPLKQLNFKKIKQKLQKSEKKASSSSSESFKKVGRGVETMFRVTLKNHIELSAIADTKANILLSVNAIIISVALSNLVPKLDNVSNEFLIIPTLILMIFSVISVVLSVLATRPNISNVTVTKAMIKQKQTNILFFGNFHKMNLETFEWGIDYLIENEQVLYNSLTKDLYYLGLVLERKYRILRMTYTVFMFGTIISAIAFTLSYYFSVN